MRTRKSWCLAFAALAVMSGCSRASSPDEEARAERDRRFEEMMTNVTLVGQSTRFGREGLSGPEEYVIERVSRIAGDRWLFQTTMKLGENEISVPVPLTILWAGETPVITLTDLSIPGMGRYSARVLFFRNHYAGTWTGGDEGGHVFGEIVERTE